MVFGREQGAEDRGVVATNLFLMLSRMFWNRSKMASIRSEGSAFAGDSYPRPDIIEDFRKCLQKLEAED